MHPRKKISRSKTSTTPTDLSAAGRGSDVGVAGLRLVRRPRASWRGTLLSTAAAGALSFAIGNPAEAGPAVCVINATVATCTGNQSAGIASGADFSAPPVTTLNVNNLTAAIAPASGTSGINFQSSGAITITSNTGSFDISATGAGARGIYAYTSPITGVAGAVTVTSVGNIAATSAGIYAQSFSGNSNSGAGAVTVSSTGNIAVTAGTGIFASSGTSYGNSGAVKVTSVGNITAAGDGIDAVSTTASLPASTYGTAGAVTVSSNGNISVTAAGAVGINALDSSAFGSGGAVTVSSTGNISATGANAVGIQARSTSPGGQSAVSVTSIGDITTTGGSSSGIRIVGNGGLTVTSTGNITGSGSGTTGIFAYSYTHFGVAGPVTVTSSGNITGSGSNANGIFAKSQGGAIAITVNSGTVSGGTGSGAGVFIGGGSTDTLTNRGTLTALSGQAITAQSITGDTGNVTVNNFGTVIGNVTLGSGTNAFNNQAGGLFSSGAAVNLGAGNTLTNAGTLSPGGAGTIQTTSLTGNLAQTATGVLAIDANLASGTADRVNVSGTASLAGAVQVQVLNPQFGAFQQTILSATGGATINGLSLLATSPALHAQLLYPDSTSVVLQSSGINFVVNGLNGNQTTLGNALNGAAQTTGLSGPVYGVLLNGPTSLSGYRGVLNQLSGEGATGIQQATFDAMTQFMGVMFDPYGGSNNSSMPGGGVTGYGDEGEPSAYWSDGRKRSAAEREAYAMFTKAPVAQQGYDPRWNVWAAGFGGSQTTDGNAAVGSNSATSRIAGGAAGADYRISPNTVAGFALAGGGTNFAVANGLGSGRSDMFQAGIHLSHTIGAAYVAGALAYGWQDVTTNRTVTLAGLDQLQAKFHANAFSGRLEGGYRIVSPLMGVGLTPYAAGQFTTLSLPAYAEQAVVGTNAFALRYGAQDVTASRSELGFRTDKSYDMSNATLTLRSRLAWAHDYSNSRSIAATFQTLPGATFVVNGAAQSADKALTTAAAEVKWRNGFSLAGTFEGEFSSNSRSYAGKAVAKYQW